MINRLNKLTQEITFGKFKNEHLTVKQIIDNHRDYYDYLIENKIFVSRIVEDYASNNYIYEKRIIADLGKNDTIVVGEVILFRRKSSSRKIIYQERNVLGTYEIPKEIVFAYRTEKRTRTWLGNGMQQDDINCSEDYEVNIRFCTNPLELDKLKNELINKHKN
jgi:hypothetical protein